MKSFYVISAITASLALLPSAATGQAAQNDPIGKLMERAAASFQAKDTAAARQHLESALAINPDHVDALTGLAFVHASNANAARALPLLRKAMELARPAERPAALFMAFTVATSLMQTERTPEAEMIYSLVLEKSPNYRDALYNRGLALYKMMRWQELIGVSTALLAIDPLNVNAHTLRFNGLRGLALDQSTDSATARAHEAEAKRVIAQSDALPADLAIKLEHGDKQVKVLGTLTGQAGKAGAPLELEITLSDGWNDVGTSRVSTKLPAKGQASTFTVAIPTTGTALSFRYRVL